MEDNGDQQLLDYLNILYSAEKTKNTGLKQHEGE